MLRDSFPLRCLRIHHLQIGWGDWGNKLYWGEDRLGLINSMLRTNWLLERDWTCCLIRIAFRSMIDLWYTGVMILGWRRIRFWGMGVSLDMGWLMGKRSLLMLLILLLWGGVCLRLMLLRFARFRIWLPRWGPQLLGLMTVGVLGFRKELPRWKGLETFSREMWMLVGLFLR